MAGLWYHLRGLALQRVLLATVILWGLDVSSRPLLVFPALMYLYSLTLFCLSVTGTILESVLILMGRESDVCGALFGATLENNAHWLLWSFFLVM
jgi:hypothetical protein